MDMKKLTKFEGYWKDTNIQTLKKTHLKTTIAWLQIFFVQTYQPTYKAIGSHITISMCFAKIAYPSVDHNIRNV